MVRILSRQAACEMESLRIGYLERSDMVPTVDKFYKEYKSYIKRVSNKSVEFIEVSDPLKEPINGTLDVDIYLTTIPLEKLDLFWSTHRGCMIDQGESALISANPAPFLHENWTIILVEKKFLVSIAMILLLVSSIFTLIKSIMTANSTVNNEKGLCRKMIDNATFFAYSYVLKSIPNISKLTSERLLLGGWLLAVQIINIFVACNMKSDLSRTAHRTIDNFQDFFNENVNTKLVFVSGTTEKEYATNMKEYGSLLESGRILELNGYMDVLLAGDQFEKLFDKSSVWLMYTTGLKMLANTALEGLPKSNLYVGRERMRMNINVAPVRKNISQTLSEIISIGNIIIFESKSFGFLVIEQEIRFLWHSWEAPNQDLFKAAVTTDLTLAFIVLGLGYFISFISLLIDVVRNIVKPSR